VFSATAALIKAGLIALGLVVSVRSISEGEAVLPSSPISCALPSLVLLAWLVPDPKRSPADLATGLGASDVRLVEVGRPATPGRAVVAADADADTDGRAVRDAGKAGGPMDVRFVAETGRGFVEDIEGGLVLEGVPVRGVEVPEVAAEANCLVGDFVGDYTNVSKSNRLNRVGDLPVTCLTASCLPDWDLQHLYSFAFLQQDLVLNSISCSLPAPRCLAGQPA
jgi:hypothetical protein